MTFDSRNAQRADVREPLSKNMPAGKSDLLPAVLRQRDLALFIILIIVVASDNRGLEFAGPTFFFYLCLALFTFLLPAICIYGWLLRRAPAHIPVYQWMLRFLNDRWAPLLLFLRWWVGILSILAILMTCLSLLQRRFPQWLSALPAQGLTFIVLLALATLLACLPLRLLKKGLWTCGLCYLVFVGLLCLATGIYLSSGHATTGILPRALSSPFPDQFSWSFFALALFALYGLNSPLFMDGEMHGSERFLRHSTAFLWWGGLSSFSMILIGIVVRAIIKPHINLFLFQIVAPTLGPGLSNLAWSLSFLGNFGTLLVLLLIVSRMCLLGARLHYLPYSLALLNRFGAPVRVFLAQSVIVVCATLFFIILIFAWEHGSVLTHHLNELVYYGPSGSFYAISTPMSTALTALIFAFAFWLCLKRHHTPQRWSTRLLLSGLCLLGCLTSLVLMLSPLRPDWSDLFLVDKGWFTLALVGIACSIVLAWMFSELPRRAALVREKTRLLAREKGLHGELQRTYTRERALHGQLQDAYEQQNNLLAEVNRLYQEQARAAVIDPITGLFNHRAFVQMLDEELARARAENASFLLAFLDLDHFKSINDTWGHPAGDAVLSGVAQRLTETLGPGDVAGRYGGEEFTLILAGATLTDAFAKAERLRQVIRAAPYRWQSTGEASVEIFVTASIGAAAYGVHGTPREALIEKADQAMYRAKLAGRDCVCIADGQRPIVRVSTTRAASSLRRYGEDLSDNSDLSQSRAFEQILRALLAVMQARDATTSAHSERLSELAETTGRQLGAAREDLLLMRLGGLVHDIGKIGIPDAILNKPGALDEEEWAIMRQHPVIGAHILEGMGGLFQQLAQVVLAHHERWDGYGYPRGLRGEEIPLAARVLIVVDSYDAMVSRRPYKDPLPIAAARAELRRNAGTQFDPTVVQTFLAMLGTEQAGRICFSTDPGQTLLAGEPGSLFEDIPR